jgi:hypothetical protein
VLSSIPFIFHPPSKKNSLVIADGKQMLAVWGDKNKRNTPCTMLENMKCGTQ